MPDDSDLLRTIRLRSLRDAPTAYGSTFERETAFPEEVWRDRLRTDGNPHFIADSPDGTPIGLVVGVRDSNDEGVAHLVAMWVDPDVRGSGVADQLIDQVIEWARHEEMEVVMLHVTEGNVRAEGVYARHGFTRTGATFVRDRDGLTEAEMECRLG